MKHLDCGYAVEGYKVDLFIKESLYSDTYRVSDHEGNPFFMKIFDLTKMPKALVISDDFVTEIETCEKLSFKNLITFRTKGKLQIDGQECPYMITDYFSGELLAERIQREGRIQYSEAQKYIGELLDGMEYMHNKELVHNDICPRNIMISSADDRNCMLKIIDMGHVSQQLGGVPPFSTHDLELFYRAPETFAGFYEKRSDVYSLAAVFYTMLEGHSPWEFDAKDCNDISKLKFTLKMKRKNEPLRFEKSDDVPAEVKKTITFCLKSTCDERPMISDFRKALKGEIKIEDVKTQSAQHVAETANQQQNAQDQEAAQRECAVEIQKNHENAGGFKNIAGMQELKDMLSQKVIFVLKDQERAKQYKLTPPNGMLLYGPPGCGKTFFAEKFAEESGFNFMIIKSSDLASIYVHGSQGKIAEMFKKAEQNAPMVLCFDEFDALVPTRSGSENQSISGEVNEFLSQLNNCSKKGIFVIGTTNRPDMIDPAVLRTGRIDKLVYVPLPDADARREMFKLHLEGRPCDGIDYDELAAMTDTYVSSDIAYIVNDAAMTAAFLNVKITQERIKASIQCTRPSLTSATIQQYEVMKAQFDGIERANTRPRVGYV